jgi:hypothetical protein
MKVLSTVLALSLFSGCRYNRFEWRSYCNKETQERVFLSCLEKLPKGPERLTASPNDWDETIDECRVAASSIACESKREQFEDTFP